jgi:hypothetical protein
MSALAMILTAAMAVPGNGPEMDLGEIVEVQRLDLSGEWEGTLCSPPDSISPVALEKGHIHFLARNGSLGQRFVCVQEGASTMRARWSGETYLGIFRYEEGELRLCFSKAGRERPTSFQSGAYRWLLILHRVKPRK